MMVEWRQTGGLLINADRIPKSKADKDSILIDSDGARGSARPLVEERVGRDHGDVSRDLITDTRIQCQRFDIDPRGGDTDAFRHRVSRTEIENDAAPQLSRGDASAVGTVLARDLTSTRKDRGPD